jgi:hypothetical protein
MRSSLVLAAAVLGGLGACTDRYRIMITDLEITNDSDSFGTPEIEVYLFDQNNDLIACAGSRQGLLDVDVAGVLYQPDALLIDDDHDKDIAISGGALRFEVWEDDDDPVCPTYPNPQGNDLLGASPAMSISKWARFKDVLSFGEVSAFRVRFD